ncbi:MAG: hypothetical protein ABJA02_01570 [Acidobacteriota bacterium]
MKLSILVTVFVAASFSFACGSSGPANSNANTSNSNTAVKIDSANMPNGLSNQPLPPSANSTPGIPATVSNLPKGATPTPGIPDAANLKKGMKPGVTPTPGIPSQEEIRKALGQRPIDVNKPAANSDQMMMKKNSNKIQKPQ